MQSAKMSNETNKNEIPQHVIEELARLFLPDIIAFYEVEENQREFEEWQKQNNENSDQAQ